MQVDSKSFKYNAQYSSTLLPSLVKPKVYDISSKHVGSALDDTLRITLVRRQSGMRTADLEVWATPELYWQHGLDWPWLLGIALIWISAIIIALWYLLWYLCHWLHTFLCKYRWNLAPLKSAWVGPCFMIFIFHLHLFNSNCLYLSFYSISIRLRGLAVKQLGAQGLCSKVTTRAWGPPKHQPHLRTHTNAKPTNNDKHKSDSYPLQYAVRKANNKIKIAENPAISAIVAVAC